MGRDVKAAILKGVEDLTYKQIGERLGIPPPADFSYKGDHASVRKMVGRGRKFFKTGLGDEGYASHVEATKEESKRRRDMSEIEREAEDLSEALAPNTCSSRPPGPEAEKDAPVESSAVVPVMCVNCGYRMLFNPQRLPNQQEE